MRLILSIILVPVSLGWNKPKTLEQMAIDQCHAKDYCSEKMTSKQKAYVCTRVGRKVVPMK